MTFKTRLFTAQDVCEIVDHYCTHSNASERDKVLGELLVWVKKNNINYEDVDGDRLPAIVTGKIMNKIEELRTPTPEAQP